MKTIMFSFMILLFAGRCMAADITVGNPQSAVPGSMWAEDVCIDGMRFLRVVSNATSVSSLTSQLIQVFVPVENVIYMPKGGGQYAGEVKNVIITSVPAKCK